MLPYEVKERRAEFDASAEAALAATADSLKTVRLKYVYFNSGSNELDERSQYEIKNIADFLKRHPNVKIELAGHTDNMGSVGLNDSLSYQRALTVYQRLLEVEKIEPSRLVAVGYGQNRPVDSNDTESGRANNRRTEFTIKEQ
ncbi:MAG: OmpA family protein [Saprospiraceae bacterium]|nr:OmpA family protein [Saprospiraceae bacterium]